MLISDTCIVNIEKSWDVKLVIPMAPNKLLPIDDFCFMAKVHKFHSQIYQMLPSFKSR